MAQAVHSHQVTVERSELEAVLDRLPPDVEMRCLSILHHSRYDTIWLNRDNEHPLALNDRDWLHVIEALDL